MAVAERMYARALFQAARQDGSVGTVRAQLRELADAVDGSVELASFLANPQVDPPAKADVLMELTDGADPLVRNFVRLVATKGRASGLRGMATELESLADAAEGRISLELTTAHQLDEAEAGAIVKQIEAASGRAVDASRAVDQSLIGGMILQAGTLRVDASVRGRLERLRRELVTRT